VQTFFFINKEFISTTIYNHNGKYTGIDANYIWEHWCANCHFFSYITNISIFLISETVAFWDFLNYYNVIGWKCCKQFSIDQWRVTSIQILTRFGGLSVGWALLAPRFVLPFSVGVLADKDDFIFSLISSGWPTETKYKYLTQIVHQNVSSQGKHQFSLISPKIIQYIDFCHFRNCCILGFSERLQCQYLMVVFYYKNIICISFPYQFWWNILGKKRQ
jgi:hypothetical protein